MNARNDPTTTRPDAAVFEVPALVPVGDAENVVLGFPWGGDDYFGFTPPRFEFQEDNDEGDAPRHPSATGVRDIACGRP